MLRVLDNICSNSSTCGDLWDFFKKEKGKCCIKNEQKNWCDVTR